MDKSQITRLENEVRKVFAGYFNPTLESISSVEDGLEVIIRDFPVQPKTGKLFLTSNTHPISSDLVVNLSCKIRAQLVSCEVFKEVILTATYHHDTAVIRIVVS